MGRIGISILLIGLINLYNIIKYGVIINIPVIEHTPISSPREGGTGGAWIVEQTGTCLTGESIIQIGINEIKIIIIMIGLIYYILPQLLNSATFASKDESLVLGGNTTTLSEVSILNIDDKKGNIEYELLVGLSILGIIFIMISKDLIMLYLGLELYNFSTYILIFYRHPSKPRMSIIYLILSSISSALLVISFLLLYKNYGTLNYESLIKLIPNSIEYFNSILLLITISIIFKLGAIPFFFWLIRLYTDLNKKILIYQLTVPKLLFFIIFNNFLYLGLSSLPDTSTTESSGLIYYFYLLFFLGLLSIVIGSIGGLFQIKDNNLLSYSSLLNIGFILFSFSILLLNLSLYYFTPSAPLNIDIILVRSYLISSIKENMWIIFQYFYIYFINLIGLFAIFKLYSILSLTTLFSQSSAPKRWANYPFFFLSFFVIILSFIGIPPFSGFFAKFYLFFTLVNNIGLEGYDYSFFNIFIFIFFTLVSSFFYFKFIFSSSISNNSTFTSTSILENKLLRYTTLPVLDLRSVEYYSLLLSFTTLFSFFFTYFLSSYLPFYSYLHTSGI